MGRALVAPSILSADFARLAEAATNVEATADLLHVDVMDYHFVPNLTFGLGTVEALRRSTALPLDCHLMIENPDRWAPPYAEAGASSVTVHVEAVSDLRGTAAAIRQAGSRVGLALKPGSELDRMAPDGRLRLWPHRHGTDAMFCTLLRRVGTPSG